MSTKKLDQLFHSKLSQSETSVAPDSWSRMELLLDEKKKTPAIYWLVASVVLMIGIAIGFWQLATDLPNNPSVAQSTTVSTTKSQDDTIMPKIAALTTAPSILQHPRLKKTVKDVEVVPSIQTKQGQLPTYAQDSSTQMTTDIQSNEVAVVTTEELLDLIAVIDTTQLSPIKITFKRNPVMANTSEIIAKSDMDSATTHKKTILDIWEESKNIDASDLWADIRDAKDDLLAKPSHKIENVKNFK